MLAPDGQPLGHCDEKRANWYLSRGLAKRVPESNDIKLTFEPAGRQGAGFVMARGNHCVVCGRTDGLTRHHVVPRCYRVWLPERMKSHNSYDLHAVCVDCHAEYEPMSQVLRAELAERYDARDVEPEIDAPALRAKNDAIAVLRHSCKMPEGRRAILVARIEAYLGRVLSEGDLKALAESDCRPRHAQKGHAQLVMEAVIASGGERDFIVMWRRHFVESMSPMFLPPWWTTDDPSPEGMPATGP